MTQISLQPPSGFGEEPKHSWEQSQSTRPCATEGCQNVVNGYELAPGKFIFYVRHCEACIQAEKEKDAAKKRRAESEAYHRRRLAYWTEVWGGKASGYHKTVIEKLPHRMISERILAWTPRRGLLLVGPTGSGKSRTAYLLLKAMLDSRIYVDVRPCVALRHSISKAARSQFPADRAELMRKLTTASLLYLDDLGQMANTASSVEALYELVEERTKRGLPIIATTQYSGERFVKSFGDSMKEKGESIARRLAEFCDIIEFPELSLSPV